MSPTFRPNSSSLSASKLLGHEVMKTFGERVDADSLTSKAATIHGVSATLRTPFETHHPTLT